MSEQIQSAAPGKTALRTRLKRPGWKIIGVLLLGTLLWMSPSLIRQALASMDFFRLRKVEIRGVKYLQPGDVIARMRVDTLRSIWDNNDDIHTRLSKHPQITSLEIERKMPSTLVVKIQENLPVALVASATGLEPYDSTGRMLPIDPSRMGAAGVEMDIPILTTRDLDLLRFLGVARAKYPTIYSRISEVRRTGRKDFAMILEPGAVIVRFPLGVGNLKGSVADVRLEDIFPVERDLAKRRLNAGMGMVTELDLRYRDQVIARLQ
jgi:hypothetical protein